MEYEIEDSDGQHWTGDKVGLVDVACGLRLVLVSFAVAVVCRPSNIKL